MATTTQVEKNSLVRVSVAFTSGGVATDPTTLTFSYRSPADGVTTTYTYGVNGQLVRDSTGNYHVDLVGSQIGLWDTVFVASGSGTAVQAALRQRFYVRDTPF